jgi:hypothetical protein
MQFPMTAKKSVTDNGEEDTRNITNADIIDHIKTINGMATSNSQVLEEKNHFFVTQVMLPSAIVGVQ